MKLKTFGKYIFLGMLFLVVVLSCVKMNTKAEATTGILYLEDTTIAECRKNGTYTAPTKKAGYVFGGWYKDEEGKYPMNVAEANAATKAYAKWVPDYVLSVKAQVNQNALDDNFTGSNKAAIRLLTSVDSRNYGEVGFNVVRGDYPEYTYYLDSKSVFTQVRVVGEKEGAYTEHTPEGVFGSDSHFFEAVTFKNMPEAAVNTELTVTPYWITPDGTRVEGAYSIKTVNLGRSWVYIGSGETVSAEGEYGTHGHPYSDFADALESVLLDTTGKIIIKQNSNVKVPSEFKDQWTQRGRSITITGENGTTETLDFSNIQYLVMGDGVTFSNMTLKYYGNTTYQGKVFANGNRLVISDNVVSNNEYTYMFGGGYDSSSVKETDITILAGKYLRVYGGGNATTSNKKGIVTGDTHVTFGGSAKAEYVCGGGGGNSNVQGTCHVEFTGGTITEGIYGGAIGSGGTNTHTSVKMSGGTVHQIFGANQVGMTGNVYVELSGGTVTRRVYGGCYNEYKVLGGWQNDKCVDGFITVAIKEGVNLQCNEDDDKGVLACSRRETKAENETGILIFNDALYGTYGTLVKSSYFESIIPYDYLVKANVGGEVSTKTDVIEDVAVLSVQPSDTEKAGTVTDTNNSQMTYFKGAGVCALPTFADGKTSSIVEVDFSPTDAQAGLESCEARIDGIYYDTFLNAINSAKARSTKPTVTVMKDCTVNAAIENVSGEEYTIVGDGKTKKVITVDSGVAELFKVRGKLKLENLKFTGGQHIVRNYAGTLTLDNIEMSNIAGVGIYHSNGDTYAYNTTISDAVKFGILVTDGTAEIDNVNISGITGADRDAINVQGGSLNIYNTKSPYNGVTISDVAQRNGIHVTGGEVVADAVTITDIKNGHGIYVENGSIKIKQANVGSEDGLIKKSALYMIRNNEAKADISNFTASNIGAQVVYLEGNASAEISNFNLTSSTDTGVRTKGTASVILKDGTLTAANGRYGIYADGTSEVTAKDVSIVRNVAMASGVNSLVYVGTGSTITLEEDNGTSMIQGNSELAGKGVLVDGTFNLKGGTITGHKLASTTNMGAGVHVKAGGVFNMSGGTVTGNTAVNGGGVALAGTAADTEAGTAAVLATFNLEGGSVTNNEATTSGGGVAAITAADFTMTGGTITSNNATTGGGVSVEGTTFNLDGGTISSNTATDGGGVYLAANASLIMDGGDIQENTVGTNSTGSRGGGVCLNASTAAFTLNNGNINGNTARAGGGVIVRSGQFTMNGGNVINNIVGTGDNGNGGALWLAAGYDFTMNGGKITGNNASHKGGALYVNNKSTINLNAGEISRNISSKDSTGNGIHSDSTSNVSTVVIKQGFTILMNEIHTVNASGTETLKVTDNRQ